MKSKAAIILGVLIGLQVLAVAMLTAVPPISRDALIHHLYVPKLYLEHGGMYEIPSMVFSYYPMNLDLLYLFALAWGNDILPKFIHGAFALLTALLIFQYLKSRLNLCYALLGVLFFLSLPVIVKLSISAYVDLGLIFFSTAALMALFKWTQRRFAVKYLLLAAGCCGLALGTKYNGLIVLCLTSFGAVLLYVRAMPPERNSSAKALGWGLLFIAVALTAYAPWMIRNYLWTHNPVYPLFDHLFNPGPVDATATHPVWTHFNVRQVLFHEQWWQTALIPLRIFFEGQDGNPALFDGRLNPFLLLLPLCAFFALKNKSPQVAVEIKMLGGFAVLFLLIVYFRTDMRTRYTGPIIPPLVILAMFGLAWLQTLADRFLFKTGGPGSQFVTCAVVAVMLMINVVYIGQQFRLVEPFSYLSGRISRDDYLQKRLPEYEVIQFANAHLPDDAKILALFLGRRFYYSNKEMIADEEILKQAFAHDALSTNRPVAWQNTNITHLMVGHDLFNHWLGYNFDQDQRERIGVFLADHTELLFASNGYGLYALR